MSVTRREVMSAAVAGLAVAVLSVVGGVWLASVIDDEPPIDGEVVLDEPGIYDQPADEVNASAAGDDVPLVGLFDAAGSEVSLGDHRGRPMVVNLWFSRCAPCQRELQDFAEVHAEVGERVRFVGVDPFDTVEAMERFAAARGVTYELLRDPERAFTNEIGVVAFPVTLFVDGAGRIVRQTGVIDADELRDFDRGGVLTGQAVVATGTVRLVTDDQPVLAASIPVLPAATVMLVRDGGDGLEVFMLQRTHGAAFARGQYVFPGGKVDEADHGEVFEPICDRLDDASASARLGLEHGGLAWLVAAARECFEEAGVLLARPVDGAGIVRFDDDAVAVRFNAARRAVYDGSLSLADLCRSEGLRLIVDQLHLVDHWVTPLGERRRFDTRFFVTQAPEAQEPLHDDGETIASLWVRPVDAIRMWRDAEIQMFPPTIVSLEFLQSFDTADEATRAAAAIGVPPVVLPRVLLDDDERILGVVRPGEPGYDATPVPEYVVRFPR